MDINKQKAVLTLYSAEGIPVFKVTPRVLSWTAPIEGYDVPRDIVIIGAGEADAAKLKSFEASAYIYNEERDYHLNFSDGTNGGYTLVNRGPSNSFTLYKGNDLCPGTGIKLDRKSSNLIGCIFYEVRRMMLKM